jgi:hypothetical protein
METIELLLRLSNGQFATQRHDVWDIELEVGLLAAELVGTIFDPNRQLKVVEVMSFATMSA